MKDIKNYIIVLLVGALALSIALRPTSNSDSTPTIDMNTNSSSKVIEYDRCLNFYIQEKVALNFYKGYPEAFEFYLEMCSKYKP